MYFTSLGLSFRAAFLYKLKREQDKTTITYRARQRSIKIELKGSIAGLQLTSRWPCWLSRTHLFPLLETHLSSKKKKTYYSVNQHENHVTWLQTKNIMTRLKVRGYEGYQCWWRTQLIDSHADVLLEAQGGGGHRVSFPQNEVFF